jgi:hypothetical protein
MTKIESTPENIDLPLLEDEIEFVKIEGIPAGQLDIDDEMGYVGGTESDPFYSESDRYGRNPDDPAGGVGLNFGDW